jgi:hypothetical protein
MSVPDPKQIIMGTSMLNALREVGVLPEDMYTTGGVTIRIQRDAMVTADLTVVLPAVTLRAALDIAAAAEQKAEQAERT